MKNRSKALLIVWISSILLIVCGCVEESSNRDTISVIVSIVPQIEMINSIGGDFVDIAVMVPAGQSPHSFEPTPEQMINIAQSSVYFKVGSGIEFERTYMNTILEQNPDLTVYNCSKEINVISFDEHYGRKEGFTDDQDQETMGTDPHVWTSPINFMKMIEVVYTGLVEIDPDHKDQYYQNYQMYLSKLETLHQNISKMLKPHEGRSFMVYHPAWGYFGDTYNLTMIAIEEDGKKPGPAGIAAIIDQAQNQEITIIFISPQFDTSSAQTIADEIGGEVIAADPLTSDYDHTLMNLAEALVSGYS